MDFETQSLLLELLLDNAENEKDLERKEMLSIKAENYRKHICGFYPDTEIVKHHDKPDKITKNTERLTKKKK